MKLDAATIAERLQARFGERVASLQLEGPSPWAVVAAESVAEVAEWLRSEPELAFDNLMCLSAVDYPGEDPPRLEVVYHLFSYEHGHAFAIKAHLPREGARLPTVERIWGVANWHEREAYDLFGIEFEDHSDLRRILLPDDWQGHPLRKDWVDPEFYNGLHVKPTPQMAARASAGEQIGVGPFDDTPPNRHVG